MTHLRELDARDGPMLEAFLSSRAETSMFLRSNLRRAGFGDTGEPFSARYGGAFEHGVLVGVAAHCWNDMLLLQAGDALEPLVRWFAATHTRPLRGLVGPHRDVVRAERLLGVVDAARGESAIEDLFRLSLERMIDPRVEATVERLSLRTHTAFAALSRAFRIESLAARDDEVLTAENERDVVLHRGAGTGFVALAEGRVVAVCTFNATLPDVVQIGGVYTPPELRSRGYARAVVAGALAIARAEGVRIALLFTDRGNTPAQRAYRSLGFEGVGEYGLVSFQTSAW